MRIVSLILMLSIIIAGISISGTVFAEDSVELIKNPGFEELNSTGAPLGWGFLDGFASGYAIKKGTDGGNALSISNTDPDKAFKQIYYNLVGNFEEGEEYQVSVDLNIMEKGGQGAVLLVQCYSDDKFTTKVDAPYFSKPLEGNGLKKWSTDKSTVDIPKGTASLRVYLRFFGTGEVLYDNVSFKGKALKMPDPEPLADKKEPFKGAGEMIVNGGFEDGMANWTPTSESFIKDGNVSLTDEIVLEGKNAIKLTKKGSEIPAFHQKITGLSENAKYTLTLWACADSAFSLDSLFEFYYDEAATKLMLYYTARGMSWTPPVGRWKQYAFNFGVPEGCKALKLSPARLQGQGSIFLDNISVYMTDKAPMAFFNTDVAFFYPDSDKGMATATLNTYSYPDMGKVTMDFAVKDGNKVLAEEKNVAFLSSVARFSVSPALLTEKKKEYTVEGILRDSNGAELERYQKIVSKYDRPNYLTKDGKFVKNGEEIIPVIAYHVYFDQYPLLREAGINVVQGYTAASIPIMTQILDEAQKNGIKVMMPLYSSMRPAAHPDNLALTLEGVKIFKDHPALFGYAVMDEPLSIFNLNPWECEEWLRKSYQVIHEIDPNHPIMMVESTKRNDRLFDTGKYADILMVDPYVSVYGGYPATFVSEYTKQANVAVNYKKPVYSILQTSEMNKYMPSSDAIRQMIYQAFFEGASGTGYYTIDKALVSGKDLNETEHWDMLKEYANLEQILANECFIDKKYDVFNEYMGQNVWYKSFVKDNEVYMFAVNMKTEEQDVKIPLTSSNNYITLNDAKGTILAGGEISGLKVENGSMEGKLKPQQSVLIKFSTGLTISKENLEKSKFSDLEGYDWAKDSIAATDRRGIINSTDLHSFSPSVNITRADFAMFLVRTLGLTDEGTEQFADVDPDAYYAKDLAAGKAAGILKGVGDGNFNPEASISRQDLMVICTRGMRYANKMSLKEAATGETGFTDFNDAAEYAQEAIMAMIREGIVVGNADKTVNPKGNATRAEAAVIMNRILNVKGRVRRDADM